MEHDDKFEFLPATAPPLPPRRAQPRPYGGNNSVDMERPKNTQTLKTRGTGAATKGTNYSPSEA
jgi:hypothetical protein